MSCSKHFKEIFSPNGLRLAWERYIRSCPMDSKDYLGIHIFRRNLAASLGALSEAVLNSVYSPVRPPKYYMPKSSGLSRTVSILPVQDALVYQCLANFTATQVYEKLKENDSFVFGSVLHPETEEGLGLLNKADAEYYFFQPYQPYYKRFAESVNTAVDEHQTAFKLETDITGFFDAIPHYNLLEHLEEKAGLNAEVLDFFEHCLTAWSGNRESRTPSVGIPQSNPSSSFFANVLLHDLDNKIKQEGVPYYRYMDDMRLYGDTEDILRKILVVIDRHLTGMGLHLNSKKTCIEVLTEDSRENSLIEFDYWTDDCMPDQPTDNLVGASTLEIDLSDSRAANSMSTSDPDDIIQYDYPEVATGDAVLKSAKRDLAEVLEKVRAISSSNDVDLSELLSRDIERGWLHTAFLFRQSVRILSASNEPIDLCEEETLPGWMQLAGVYFWRANQFCRTIAQYGSTESAKQSLLLLRSKYKVHEWVQYEILRALADSQSFLQKELRAFYQELREEPSWYVRRGLYHLLFAHSKSCSGQFIESVRAHAAKETDDFLKREILCLMNLGKEQSETRMNILREFGVL